MDANPSMDKMIQPENTEPIQSSEMALPISMMVFFLPITAFSLYILTIILWQALEISFLGYAFEFFANLAIFSARYIPELCAAYISLFGLFLFLWPTLYLIYFSRRWKRGKILYIPLAILFASAFVGALYLREFRQECVNNYHKIETHKSQTLPFDQLKAECGEPAFYRELGNVSHWVYTDGDQAIGVYITETGEAKVSDANYWLFD